MELTYTLDAGNFLNHQLYHASQSETIRKRRYRTKFLFPLIYVVLGLLLMIVKSVMLGNIIIGLGVLWYFFYPMYERKAYVRNYESFIKENFTDSIGKLMSLQLNEDHIILKSGENESNVGYSELKEIIEIPHEILIKIGNGNAIIIPKAQLENYSAVEQKLESIAERYDIDYMDYQHWKWG